MWYSVLLHRSVWQQVEIDMGVSSCLGPLLMLGVPSAVASSIKLAVMGVIGSVWMGSQEEEGPMF